MPLAVLTAATFDVVQAPGMTLEDARQDHLRLQSDLTNLSTNRRQLMVSGSGHEIYLYQPSVVIRSIDAVVSPAKEISEILGLRWTDFDFKRSVVLIQRSAVGKRVNKLKTEYSEDLGTAVTVRRNLSEVTGDSTPARKRENTKVAELLDILAKVPPGESLSACRKELELQIAQSLRELEALRAKEFKLAKGPNHDLTVMQRLFVLFPPRDRSTWIIQALAYAFIAGGPLVILMLLLFRIGGAGTIGDVMVMVIFGSLAFRAWALAERKWTMESLQADRSDRSIQAEPGPLQVLFVLRKSRGWRMLVAQLCMWTCLFCAVESLEDIFLSALDANKAVAATEQIEAEFAAKSGLLLFLTSLLGACLCRAWAAAEWQHGSPPSPRAFTKAIFPLPKGGKWGAWLLVTTYVAALVALIVSVAGWSLIFTWPRNSSSACRVRVLKRLKCGTGGNHSAMHSRSLLGSSTERRFERF
jgi:hypothetical protein